MPAADLVQRVRLLELIARRNAAGWLIGDYLTAIRGQGMVFHESRKYVSGEPARRIDWNVTARLGEPYVKVHLEERQRQVIIAVDVSPSMHAGFQDQTKLELAIELAATLAASAHSGGDHVGHVIFADQVLSQSRPRGGRGQLFRVLQAMLEGTVPWTRPVTESDPRAAIHAIESYRRGRFVVFLISDFIDHDLPADLRFLRARHDVSLLHVYDPFEFQQGRQARLPAFAPEGLQHGLLPANGETWQEMSQFLRTESARHRITYDSFATGQPLRGALDHFFHRKRRRAGH